MLEISPKYIAQVQKPYLCNMACLNMIIYRNFWIIYEQEDLAHFFNIKIHPKYLPCFNSIFDTTEKTNDDEGLKTIEEEQSINSFFAEKHHPLTATAYTLSNIHDLKIFIEKHITEWNDMWVEYKIEWIWEWFQWIHDWLIESISWWEVTLINPWAYSPSRYTIHIDILAEALSAKFARETGIVVIKKT